MMQLQARRALSHACTCGFATAAPSSFRSLIPRQWMQACSSSNQAGPSSEAYDTAEDYHDPANAQMLTARVAKTKKRMVKRGQDFVDKLTIQVRAGKGGDGGVAFHREKFVAKGPPSGGNGGHGGNVYIKAVPHYSSLSHIKKTMLAHNGQAGAGSWLHGRRGNDLTIEVPYGTVVREIRNDSTEETAGLLGQGQDAAEDDFSNESWSEWRKRIRKEKLIDPEGTKERRSKMFVLYPNVDQEIELLDSKTIDELEFSLLEEERREKMHRLAKPPVEIDFDAKLATRSAEEQENLPASADKMTPTQDERILLLRGGRGGFGNPYFNIPNSRRSPKLATRGKAGESMRIDLELKTLADIGLVGFPNAGKSTLLQALTHSRTAVASYAFTTLTPQIGTLIVYDDFTYSTTTSTAPIEESAHRETSPNGANRERLPRPANKEARQEKLRLTIADCPGLLPNAADNVGLGHDFLRHIERSKVLVFVVDLSGNDPVKDLQVLKRELEDYKAGLSNRARVIVANKADKVKQGDEQSINNMKQKLDGIRRLARDWEGDDGMERIIIPMSAMQRGNVTTFVDTLVSVLSEST